MNNSVWILTLEVNDYNQHGEYFKAIWKDRPTRVQLANWFEMDPLSDVITQLITTGESVSYGSSYYLREEEFSK